MRLTNNKHIIVLIIGLISVSCLTGCTDWKAEYDKLYVRNQNLEGQLDGEKKQTQELASRISKDQQKIIELQKQIEEQKKTPAQASGFEGFNVAFNPNEGTITVTLENSILFGSGQADLIKATSAELNSIYSVLKSKYAGKKVDVVGHTDNDPISKSGWKDNWELSAERALTVTRYLVSRGWPENQIQAVACGQARPVVSNNSAANKAKNRRVEIVVHMK